MDEQNKVIIYTASDGQTKIDVKLEDETLWLTQAQMCELYQTSKSNISEHIRHIFEEGELQEDSVVRKFRTTAADGKSYLTTFYNLDMIIALGYRVRSIIATRFRQWATLRLKEYMVKGFTLDDERLKKLGGGGFWHWSIEWNSGTRWWCWGKRSGRSISMRNINFVRSAFMVLSLCQAEIRPRCREGAGMRWH